MKIQYKPIARPNPQDPEAPPRYYVQVVSHGQVSLEDLADRISDEASLTPADVTAVLTALVNNIPKLLMQGFSIDLGDLGTFWLRVQSEGAESPETLNPSNIRQVRPFFRPRKRFSRKLRKARFTKSSQG